MSVSSPILYSHDDADSEIRLPLAEDRQSWRQPSASPREFGCRSWTSEPRLRPRLALAGNRPTRHAPGNSVGRLVERHLMPLSNIGIWVAFAYAARDARCSSSQCSLIHPRFPACTTGTLNRERIAAVVSPTKTPMMNHICSLAGTSPASRNPRRRQRRRRSLAESTGIATRRRSGLIRRLNVNLSCGNWPASIRAASWSPKRSADLAVGPARLQTLACQLGLSIHVRSFVRRAGPHA
jgi:hypothetical protein